MPFAASDPWLPTVYTRPLSEDFPSDGYRLLDLVDRYWRNPDGSKVTLDEWQRSLIIAILERFPDDHPNQALAGRLRYRQVVISLSRQNGKSLIAAILGLYGLVQHVTGPYVVGVASTREQAQIVYDRTAYVIRNVPRLNSLIKPTGTRGLKWRDGGGRYEMRASKGDALQGLPVSLGIADELHIMQEEVWDSLVVGQRAQRDGLLIGITTAGDDDSILLKRLYRQGHEAAETGDRDSRFGFFLWEAPEGATIDTPGAIEASTPAAACGRLDVATIRSDVKHLPEADQQRYTLNRFSEIVGSWLPAGAWRACRGSGVPADVKSNLVFSVERTGAWEHASIVATAKIDGRSRTELVATIAKPTLDQIERALVEIATRFPRSAFVGNTFTLGKVLNNLKDRGYEVFKLTPSERAQACSLAYAKIAQGLVDHPDNTLVRTQMPNARRKNSGTGWTLVPGDESLGIDSVLATVDGIFVAEIRPEKRPVLL